MHPTVCAEGMVCTSCLEELSIHVETSFVWATPPAPAIVEGGAGCLPPWTFFRSRGLQTTATYSCEQIMEDGCGPLVTCLGWLLNWVVVTGVSVAWKPKELSPQPFKKMFGQFVF